DDTPGVHRDVPGEAHDRAFDAAAHVDRALSDDSTLYGGARRDGARAGGDAVGGGKIGDELASGQAVEITLEVGTALALRGERARHESEECGNQDRRPGCHVTGGWLWRDA